ncbi:MAG: formylmethanofuran dehydrogenase [Desulfobacteraceae bacterium]|nr:MAG: formylmethanofuran dehydrogenase [Desulfobacteraceae bacterium]
MGCIFGNELIEATIRFHGHMCPGLAIGIRAAEVAFREVGRDGDEEIVAVVETDMCGVDAVQYLTGCTFGKGNLIHLDYGKNAFSFYRRSDGKSLRVVAKPSILGAEVKTLAELHRKMSAGALAEEEKGRWQAIRQKITADVMHKEIEELFEVKPVQGDPPARARILSSLTCDGCGEAVMETRLRAHRDRRLCAPCFNSLQRGA